MTNISGTLSSPILINISKVGWLDYTIKTGGVATPQIQLSASTIAEDAASGSVVGGLSVSNGSGSYLFSITSDPDSKFVIDGNNLETNTALDYETATSHSVTVEADNGVDTPVSRVFSIAVTDVDDTAPMITSSDAFSVAENSTLAHSLTANEAVTWTITGGTDQADYEISGSTLRWASNGTKDYEVPDDADTNNTYVVQVTATDGAGNATNQTITATVTNVAEAVAPDQFDPSDWSVADDETGGDITISIATLPSNGGSAITDIEYQVDSGSWVSVGAATTGDYPITGLADDVEVDIAIRAVNAVGNGASSATKAVTPTTAAAPFAYQGDFTTGDYKVAGSPVSEATALSIDRNSPAWVENLAGVWSYVAPDVPARSDAGLMLNTAADAIVTDMGWGGVLPSITWNSSTGEWELATTAEDIFGESVSDHFNGATPFYCNVNTGADGNDGLTALTPRRKIQDCIGLGNATGAPYTILIDGSGAAYGRDRGISLGSTGTIPTQDFALIGINGTPVIHTADPLPTPVASVSYPGIYEVAKSNVARILRPDSVDENGDLAEWTHVNTPEEVSGGPWRWAQPTGTTLYLNTDGAVPTDANCRALRKSPMLYVNAEVDGYIDNIAMQGGADTAGQGSAYFDGAGRIVINNSSFKYPGGILNNVATSYNAITLKDCDGTHLLTGVAYDWATKDGFNSANSSVTPSQWVISAGCTSRWVGTSPSTSNNAITGHQKVQQIDIYGIYEKASGGTVVFIDNSAVLCIGTQVIGDRDDGGIGPVAYRVTNQAKGWLVDCSANMTDPTDESTRIQDTAELRTRNFNNVNGVMDGAELPIGAINITQALLADTLTIAGTGTNDWTLVYDNDSTEEFTAVSGDLIVDATDLSRPLVKSYTAVAA